MNKGFILFTALVLLLITSRSNAAQNCANNNNFNIGAGIYDITGPAAEEGMMGYGMLNQQTAGIYQRLWARAFIIESPCNKKRIVFVNVDLGQAFQGIKQQVIKILKEKYGSLYDDANVLITATHTHSGPGGYSTYAFYNLSTLGFSRKNFNTIVLGILHAIERAQHNLTPATIHIAKEHLLQVGFNRSPAAYLLNPEEERKRYSSNIDTEMTLIRFDTNNNKPLGLINWFPIHGVSMNNKNHLINGDNKGYAEYLFEKDFHSNYSSLSFVAAFAQANAGDISANPYGIEGSTGIQGIRAVENAGFPQYQMAKKLFSEARTELKGEVDYRQIFVAMDNITISPEFTDGGLHTTCPAAIGVSMLAGTQDGEGLGKQGTKCNTLGGFFHHIACEMVTTTCQGVKPIALQTGKMKPYPWTPNILPLQLLQIGNLIIVAVPFELTTMAGRRLRETISQQFPDYFIVLSTLANAYAGYVTTFEEYQAQRYEGASTHFGPWTLAALQQEFTKLAKALRFHLPIVSTVFPKDLSHFQINIQPGVIFDDKPLKKHFGDIHQDAKKEYHSGESVKVVFWGAHPKNNYRIQKSFLTIERFENNTWQTIAQDRDWETEYHWQRSGIAASLITIIWRIPQNTPPGKYRVVHYGDAKSFWERKIRSYKGYSSEFNVI